MGKPYHKITTVFDRNPDTNFKTLIEGQFAKPEFEYLKDVAWRSTEKVDGTNIRVIFTKFNPNNIGVEFKGKKERANIPPFLEDKLKEMFTPQAENVIFDVVDIGEDVTLYGEGYGAKIQKGGGNYIPNGVNFVLFDVRVGDYWLRENDVSDVAERLGIKTVPFVCLGTIPELVTLVKEGFNSAWGVFQAEGIVAKPCVQLFNRQGERVIWKLKGKDFPETSS